MYSKKQQLQLVVPLTKPKKKKKKQITISKLKEKIETLVKIQAKERDNWICQWCGKKVEGVGAHGSHVIPVSRSQLLRFDIKNIKCLCYYCHYQKWHNNPLEAAEWFKKKFPKRWKYLKEKEHEVKKWTRQELEALLIELKEKP